MHGISTTLPNKTHGKRIVHLFFTSNTISCAFETFMNDDYADRVFKYFITVLSTQWVREFETQTSLFKMYTIWTREKKLKHTQQTGSVTSNVLFVNRFFFSPYISIIQANVFTVHRM